MKHLLLWGLEASVRFLKRLRCLVTLAHAREVFGVTTALVPVGNSRSGWRRMARISICKHCGGRV
jgi:hypothetical protein